MKYQYNIDGSQSQSKIKTYFIRAFVAIMLFGFLYEGYKFFQSPQDKIKRVQDQYCGKSTCYQLLNVQRSARDEQIKKSYRMLARKFHPDKNNEKNAVQIFQLLNKAYQTLTQEKSRYIYDLYLNNPEQSQYRRQFQYYNHKYIQNPQVPVSSVIIGIILCISLLQYVMRKQMYERAVESISSGPDFKIKVNQRCGNNKKDKQSVREQMIKQIQIQGGLAKPQIQDILGYKIIILPYTFAKYIRNQLTWIVKYYILRKQYDDDAISHLTQKSLNISHTQWKNLQELQKSDLKSKSLWIPQNKKNFMEERKRQWLEQLKKTNPNKYNRVINYLKTHKID